MTTTPDPSVVDFWFDPVSVLVDGIALAVEVDGADPCGCGTT